MYDILITWGMLTDARLLVHMRGQKDHILYREWVRGPKVVQHMHCQLQRDLRSHWKSA